MFPHARRDPEEPQGSESSHAEKEHIVIYDSDDEPDFCVSIPSDTQVEQSSSSDSPGRRSPIELFVDMGEKVEALCGRVSVDINRALTAKRQRLETNTKSLEGIDQNMKQVWNSREDAVAKLNGESAQAFTNLFQQWDLDFQKVQEKYVKLMNDFQQEEKAFQQCRLVQSKRLKTIKQVHEQFIKNLEDVEKKNDCLLMDIHNELKEEMNRLRRKIMKESHQQEMVSLQQAFQSMMHPKGHSSGASE
ncbi:synaptonemal complex protein 3-like [Microtus pennsylvanicus]|uniref:synaptonemal complex protein 3-like n=1 Tax=Microtus pennsylvanicus TaxID=10058 RepID=UPI003F6CF1B2